VTRTNTAVPTPTVACPPAGISDVAIGTFFFDPQVVTIGVGGTVRWTNTEAFHSTQSDQGLWDSGALGQGEQFSFTFNAPGVYPYRCGLHPKLHSGTVIVTGNCPTQTVQATVTRTGTAVITPTACTVEFSDVPPEDTFYADIMCLACRGIIGGYSDGTFRTYNDITRGQISKMVSNSAGFQEPIDGQTYEDVPFGSPFYYFIERLSQRGHMGGYPCGQRQTEPCIPPTNRPYFRPNESATRGQLSKIVSNAAGFTEPHTGIFYTDVQEDNPFYVEIMRLTTRGVMSGYPCGTVPSEPCDSENRPYFRWGNNVTRGQASKIVANTFFPGCEIP
jgi:plastocyanin